MPLNRSEDALSKGRARKGLLLALAALWVLPLWLVTYLPMVDYPQQLALAAILRWYGDPVRHFQDVYTLALWTPHGLFKLLVAGLAWAVPIETAGRLVLSLSLLGVGAGALAVCRRTGRPAVYALLAMALTYNYAFFWGFVDNLIAYPLVLGGAAMADRLMDRRFSAGSWLAVAGLGLLFYTVHLQFLLIYAGTAGWLALCRLPGWRRLALWVSALVPCVLAAAAVMAYGVLRSPVGVISGYEARMRSSPTLRLPLWVKLAQIPDLLFGRYPDLTAWVLAVILLAVALVAVAFRARDGEPSSRSWRETLFRTRFATLAAWLGALYLALPEFRAGYLIADRIAPLAVMVAVVALPAPAPARRRLVAVLAVALAVFQLGQTVSGFLRFRAESAGLEELLAGTEPGQSLAGLIYDRQSASWPGVPVYLHFPAWYQVEKGGRILFSFAELFQTSARFKPGQSWDGLLREWDEWNPQLFSYERHGGRFRYFLVRGGPEAVLAAFHGDPARLGLRGRTAGRWWLFERAAVPGPVPPGAAP
jgi:hypothetical protein